MFTHLAAPWALALRIHTPCRDPARMGHYLLARTQGESQPGRAQIDLMAQIRAIEAFKATAAGAPLQAALEEHGDRYRRYMARTPAFVPRRRSRETFDHG